MKVLIPHTFPGAKFGVAQVGVCLEPTSPCCGAQLVIRSALSEVCCTKCNVSWERATFVGSGALVLFRRDLARNTHVVQEWVKLWTDLEDVEVSIT